VPTTPTNLVTDRLTSQGLSLVGGAKKVSIKVTRNANSTPKLDSSTLELPHGSDRTYEDGLTDNGPSGSTTGTVVTVSAEGFGTKPASGSTITAEGATCKCMESQYDDNVGELRGWSASYTSDFSA
jgi:hypothetical protein